MKKVLFILVVTLLVAMSVFCQQDGIMLLNGQTMTSYYNSIGFRYLPIDTITGEILRPPRIVTIPKNADGGWWKPVHGLQPGDTVLLTSLSYGYLVSVVGTKEKPIVFLCLQNSNIGQPNNSTGFGLILEKSSHVKIIGNNFLTIGCTTPNNWLAQGLGLPFCNDIEVSGVKFNWNQAAIFSNPKTGGPFQNFYIHHNNFTNTGNYGIDAWNCAHIYIGNTDIANFGTVGTYNNVEISFNKFTGSMADGIQITVTNGAKIHDNEFKTFGTYNGDGQRTAIVFGGCTSGEVYDNQISDGTGPAFSVFGAGVVIFRNNTVKNVATNSTEPVLYFNKKCTGGAPLVVQVTGNSFDKSYSKFIMQDGGPYAITNTGNTFGAVNTIVFYNVVKSVAYMKNNCPNGVGTSVTYTVPAGKFSSTISQLAADNLAMGDINLNGQIYANTNGICNITPPATPTILYTFGFFENGIWRVAILLTDRTWRYQ